MKKEKYNVVVGGATGAVGNEMVSILEERKFPVDQLKLLASTRGAGTQIRFNGKQHTVEVMTENSFAGMDIGLFSPGGSVSEKFALLAGRAGCGGDRRGGGWLGDHVEKARLREVVATIRQLDVGDALIVSPGWLKVEKVIHIRERETFDSSATPKAMVG